LSLSITKANRASAWQYGKRRHPARRLDFDQRYRRQDQRHVVIYSQWRDFASVEAMRANPDMIAYFPRIASLAALDSFAGEVVYNHHA
jgi:hypothetical protein